MAYLNNSLAPAAGVPARSRESGLCLGGIPMGYIINYSIGADYNKLVSYGQRHSLLSVSAKQAT